VFAQHAYTADDNYPTGDFCLCPLHCVVRNTRTTKPVELM